MKKLDNQQQLKLENKILRLLNHEVQKLENENAKKHLSNGLGIRLRMMSKSKRIIHEKIDDHDKDKALEGFILNEMNIHLNSYYLNLIGSLDNLAWAINYFYQLEDEIDEGDSSSRFYTNLFKTDFINDLEKHNFNLVAEIKKFEDWSIEVKEFRDPAAHRIPLQFIAGVVDKEQREQIKQLEEEANDLIKKSAKLLDSREVEDIQESSELFSQSFSKIMESSRIGNYIPTFISTTDEKQDIRYLPNQLGRDHSLFLILNEYILNSLTANT